ncbi:MAG: hypothetical protein K2H15_02280, partial [Muribaculaceae bacterium]|nr:hypothetical protein [Muribaculaceae bacterium]
MIKLDLSSDFLKFVEENADKDPVNLRLKWQKKDCGFDVEAAITQIECRKRCRSKLENFLKNPLFLFPDRLSSCLLYTNPT